MADGAKPAVLLLALALAPFAGASAGAGHEWSATDAQGLRISASDPAIAARPIDLSVGQTSRANYLLPALQIGAFQFLLNRFDNRFIGDDFAVSRRSIRRNLHSGWTTDNDSFIVNQIGHPYQGSVYYGLARSNGLPFWHAFGYAFAGSAVWEIAGETTPPSKNDQITTSIGGSFLGESLFRMSHLLLERGGGLARARRGGHIAALGPESLSGRCRRQGLR